MVAATRRAEPAVRLDHLPALGVESGERAQGAEVGTTLHGLSTDRERLVVASERLIDRGPLRVQGHAIGPQRGRGVEVGQGRREPVEDGRHPGARDEGPGLARRLADELLRERRRPLGVGNPAQHVPAQGDQLHELGAIAYCQLPPRRLPRVTVDPRLEIPQGDGARRRRGPAVRVH